MKTERRRGTSGRLYVFFSGYAMDRFQLPGSIPGDSRLRIESIELVHWLASRPALHKLGRSVLSTFVYPSCSFDLLLPLLINETTIVNIRSQSLQHSTIIWFHSVTTKKYTFE